jgi:hypothetical protein
MKPSQVYVYVFILLLGYKCYLKTSVSFDILYQNVHTLLWFQGRCYILFYTRVQADVEFMLLMTAVYEV